MVTGSICLVFNSWPKMCDIYFASAPFNANSGVPLSSAKKKAFLATVQHDFIIHFLFFGDLSISPETLFVLQHLFWSRRLACFWLLSGYSKFMLSSQGHIHTSIHSYGSGHNLSYLMTYLTVFYIGSG